MEQICDRLKWDVADMFPGIGLSSFEWIGDRYASLGEVASEETKLFWDRLQRWVRKNSQKIPRAGALTGPDAEIWTFPSAFAKFRTDSFMMRILNVLILFWCLMLAGCSKRQNIGGGFEVRQAQNWNPDGHPGTRLYYEGKEVWPQVSWNEGGPQKYFNNNILLFVSSVPDTEDLLPLRGFEAKTNSGSGPYPYGNQVFAVKAGGRPVLVSALVFAPNGAKASSYEVLRCDPDEALFRLVFRYWVDEDHDAECTNSATWQDITKWIAQSATNAEPRKSEDGRNSYLLPKL
jgi:hypothetical protein